MAKIIIKDEPFDIKEFSKRFQIIKQKEDFATNSVDFYVYDRQENVNKTISFDRFWLLNYLNEVSIHEQTRRIENGIKSITKGM